MDRFQPYHAVDTMGIQFEVFVDGDFFCAHVPDQVLASRFGPADDERSRLAVFVEHQQELDFAATRRIHREGPQIVLLRLADFG